MQNLPSVRSFVKRKVDKKAFMSKVFFSFALFFGALSITFAETDSVRAMYNAQHVTNLLHGVSPQGLEILLDKIESGKIRRPAPDQPIWILDSETKTILYYQGQPAFKNQPADNLVDDQGQRFGTRALESAKASRSGWHNLMLGGANYSAFCQSKYPTVVCSLVVKPIPVKKK